MDSVSPGSASSSLRRHERGATASRPDDLGLHAHEVAGGVDAHDEYLDGPLPVVPGILAHEQGVDLPQVGLQKLDKLGGLLLLG